MRYCFAWVEEKRREGTARERKPGGDLGLTSNQTPCGFLGKTTSVMGPSPKHSPRGPNVVMNFFLISISQNGKECNNPRQGNYASEHFFQEINWGAPLPSIVSSEIITRLMFFKAGTSYIKSSITSSKIERNPLAPVFIDEALVAMA